MYALTGEKRQRGAKRNAVVNKHVPLTDHFGRYYPHILLMMSDSSYVCGQLNMTIQILAE